MSSRNSASPLPVAVIGCGRMGRHHARVYSGMPQARLIGVYDIRADAAEAAAAEFNCRAFEDLHDLLDQAAAVTIAVPSQHHAAVAEDCLKRGIACLIEKPLAGSVEQAERIVELSRRHDAVVQVGHIERFNPAFRAVQELDVRPRFIEVDRVSPMTFRSIDVGVVLDMMIHDIDLVLNLAGWWGRRPRQPAGTEACPVERIDAVGTSVIGEVEDICNARLQFANGCVANITASRLALKTERKMRIFSADAYVSLDFQKRDGICVRRTGNLDAVRAAADRVRRGEVRDVAQLNWADLVRLERLPIEQTDPLVSELEAFIHAVQTRTPPPVTAEEGLAAVQVATRIVQAIPPQTL